MKKTFAAVATATALLVAGCSAPDNAAETVSQAPAAQTVTVQTEDESLPSGIGGLTIAELRADAAATLALLPTKAPAGEWTGISEWTASYLGSAPALPATCFTMESVNQPGVIHAYTVTAALRA
jgi:hypothetical protein